MLEKLKKHLKIKQEERADRMHEAEEATDIAELRALQRDIEVIDKEIRSFEGMIAEIEREEAAAAEAEERAAEERKADGESERTKAVNAEIPGMVQAGAAETRKADDEEGMEYRKAFQQFVTRGTPIPAELREAAEPTDASATTVPGTDGGVGEAVPTILVNRIIEKMESTGMILPLVNKTSFKAGINIPTFTLKPEASWVGEGEGSVKQKQVTGAVSFSHHKLRCEISMSMEVSVMAISAFETAFVKQVSTAMVKAMEKGIVNGVPNEAGNGFVGPRGILSETPETGQAIEAKEINYDLLVNAEAALPQAYESDAVWCMSKKTFMYFYGMTDAEGQPIARVNYGIVGRPERTLLGRTVVLCGDYMDSFSKTLTTGKVFAFLFNFSDYTLNTIYNMGIQRKQDWDTEDMLTKAVMSVDGRVIDKGSLVTLKKKA